MKHNASNSLRPDPHGNRPDVHPTAFVDPTAQVIGCVRVGPRVFIGPGAIIRADEIDHHGKVAPVEIGPECNVQDGVIIHALGGTRVTIGPQTSLAHGCIVHGPCTLGEWCFVGFGAKLFDAVCGAGAYIGMGAVVCQVRLPANSCVPPAAAILSHDNLENVGTTSPAQHAFMQNVVAANLALADGYGRLDEPSQKKPQSDDFASPHPNPRRYLRM